MLHIPRRLQAHQPKQHNDENNTAGEERQAEDIRARARSGELGETRRHCRGLSSSGARDFQQGVRGEGIQVSECVQSDEESIASIVVAEVPREDGSVMVENKVIEADRDFHAIVAYTLGAQQGLDSRLSTRLHNFSIQSIRSSFCLSWNVSNPGCYSLRVT